ncbi:hypothetical protein [Sphingomonas sp.]|uniref:hypothetical protein n=1 Tax=Sphingomonas sp. TaxID=28214 RepID=UPI0025E75CA2|nr:hypothetical protein [Sphingomonas sp.]
MNAIHYHTHHHGDAACAAKLDEILTLVKGLSAQGVLLMATLQQILTEVQAETTAVDGLIKLLDGVKAQLSAALAAGPLDQATVDQIFAAVTAEKQKVVDALAANVAPPAA